MKPRKLSIHKDVWKKWKRDADAASTPENDSKNYIRFVEEHSSFLVFYTEDCSPKIKHFKTFKAATRFADKFPMNEDNWIDFIVNGDIALEYTGADGIERSKGRG